MEIKLSLKYTRQPDHSVFRVTRVFLFFFKSACQQGQKYMNQLITLSIVKTVLN